MSTLFKSLLIAACILRLPLSLIPILLKGLVPFFNRRLDFERRNLLSEHSRSFAEDQLKADYCFEVSSEGELEQVRPLIDLFLKADKKLEILFSSPSVETKLLKLSEAHPMQVRIFRLPLLSFSPVPFLYFQNFWWWVTAPTVLFCRYDFFPELLMLSGFKKKLVLLSAATKKWNWYKQQALGLFSVVGAVTPNEARSFQQLTDKEVYFCDMRIPRILDRHDHYERTLKDHHDKQISDYFKYLQSLRRDQKLILGSAWASDLSILTDPQLIKEVQKHELHLCVVPHKINSSELTRLKEELQKLFGHHSTGLLSQASAGQYPAVTILDKTGILCELYGIFPVAYVGGGYERSIHSVLEPFLSEARVITGPKVYRSAEYDLIHDQAADEIAVLKNPLSFYTVYKDLLQRPPNGQSRAHIRIWGQEGMQKIINKITEL